MSATITVDLEELETQLAGDVSRRFDVYVPVDENGAVVFRRLTTPASGWLKRSVSLTRSVLPANKLLTPQTDPVLRFQGGPTDYEVSDAAASTDLVILGVKPCDARALKLLDKVFADESDIDQVYVERRQKTVLIGVACEKPEPTCFCKAMGVSPWSSDDCDLMIYPMQGLEGLALKCSSDKGQAFLAGMHLTIRELPAETSEEIEAHYRAIPQPLSEFVGHPEALSLDSFELPIWGRISERCLSCGLCTYLCPTCYCFAVVDKSLGERGLRARCWDSCMFPDFLKMAGGHNPRPTKKERVRQRFMHKLCYTHERYGQIFCVGCGRCVEKCPVGLHFVDVLSQLRRELAGGGGDGL
ncbi:MAG TPA: hypothetical protein GXX40_06365 [Firmicutes bacterium]|nr:hypothetical protein [Bacillota bacterium]